jgi:hypothetical protein
MPTDRSPHGEEILHELPERPFPQPRPPVAGRVPALPPDDGFAKEDSDIARRPPLPDHPERMAADVEDEDDDPVVDSGPGIADGVRQQRK